MTPRGGVHGRRRTAAGSWWLLPAVLVVGATLGFVALAAPRWTHHVRVPAAIAVRADMPVTGQGTRPAAVAVHRWHRHRPPPTESPSPPPPADAGTSVTVVTPVRPVVTEQPSPDRQDYGRSDDKHGGDGSDDGSNGVPDR
jgi:hypothetical protein